MIAIAEKPAKALRIAGTTGLAVAIHIQGCCQPRIRGEREPGGIIGAIPRNEVGKCSQRSPLQIIVEPLNDQHIGGRPDNRLHDSGDLWVIAFQQVAQQHAGACAGKFGVVGSDADRVGR